MYFFVLGILLAGFNQAATAVVMTGFLVCNCADEIGFDLWLSMVCLGLYTIVYLISNRTRVLKSRSKLIYVSYFIISSIGLVTSLSLLVLDLFDT